MVKVTRERWEKNYSEWFRDVIFNAEVYDYRYPIKGVGVWRPYGMKLRQNILSIMRRLLDSTGHEEVLFPTLIPEELIRKESEHIAKFEEEIFWVTRGGRESLEGRLALRPTSETAIMEMFKLWIHSHKDLPVRIYQIVSVFRCETKATAPMIRVREITTFKEAHTAHATREDAERQVREAVEIYKKFFDELGIPYLISVRPEWDKFAGAVYSIAFDTLMPDGKALQIGTVHYLGQNFAKAFDVTYLKPDGTHEYVHTTSYGISERVVAAVISIHGDDHGMALPPNVAPVQVVIVPILYGKDEATYSYAKEVYEELKSSGLRVVFDDREDITPGEKYYYWELRGVPVRVEIGPRDLANKTVTLVRRDSLERITVSRPEAVAKVKELLEEIHNALKERAWSWFKSKIFRAKTHEEAREMLEQARGIIEVPWCEKDECGLKLEEITGGHVLGIDVDREKASEGIAGLKCVICGEEAKVWARIAKRY